MKPIPAMAFIAIFFAACKKHDAQLLTNSSAITLNYLLTDSTFDGQYPVNPQYVHTSGALNRTISITSDTGSGYLVYNSDTFHTTPNTGTHTFFSSNTIYLYGRTYQEVYIEMLQDSISIYCNHHISAASSERVTYKGHKAP